MSSNIFQCDRLTTKEYISQKSSHVIDRRCVDVFVDSLKALLTKVVQ